MTPSNRVQQRVTVMGAYSRGYEYASGHWEQICAEHEEEFPQIRQCHPGTFNVCMEAPYKPPGEDEYRRMARERGQTTGRYADGNHLSPRAKVIEINGKPVEAWIYRGGHDNTSLELLSACQLAHHVSLRFGHAIIMAIVEFPDEGEPGMPAPPPPGPGKNVPTA